jgi:hypothetical protein
MGCIGEMLVDSGVRMRSDRRVHVHAANKYLNWPSRNLIMKDNYHVEISTQAASSGYLVRANLRLHRAKVFAKMQSTVQKHGSSVISW